MICEFPYRKSGGDSYKPLITVNFSRLGKPGIDSLAFVDSGADISYIPYFLAHELGISTRGQPETVNTVAGPRQVYNGTVDVTLKFGSEGRTIKNMPVHIPATPGKQTICILGRRGFFEEFNVTFKEREKKIVLEDASC
jgi:hypothetical protein